MEFGFNRWEDILVMLSLLRAATWAILHHWCASPLPVPCGFRWFSPTTLMNNATSPVFVTVPFQCRAVSRYYRGTAILFFAVPNSRGNRSTVLPPNHKNFLIFKPRLHDTTCCQNGCQTGLYPVYKHSIGCQTRLTIGLTTVWMFVYTIQPVVKPVVQPGCTTGLTTGCIV